MGTTKRDRQRANRQSKLVAAHEAQRKAQSRRRLFRFGGLVVAFLVIAYLISVFAGGGDDEDQTASSTTATTAPGSPVTVAVSAPPAGASITGDTPCPPADGSAERTTTFEKAPPTCIDPAKSYTAAIATSVGTFTVALDPTTAPQAVNNFVVLSRYHYYDGVPFHRIVTDFVAQAGDANPQGGQLGTGGPGYTFADELPASGDAYVPGVVAMANSGPDTNGSQFFVFVGPNNPFASNPAYTIFGHVTEGMDTTVAAIMAAGTEDQGVTQQITIDSVTITEA
jgi:cyclophilin family peptidyl-prolyl cis-trans isomerase